MPKNILFKEYKTQDYIEIAEQTEKWVDATKMTANEDYLHNAKSVADHIIATDVGTRFYDEILNAENKVTDKLIHVKNMPGWKIGFYNGPTAWWTLLECCGSYNY